MSRDPYETLHDQIHGWLHRKNISSAVRRASSLPVAIATDIGLVRKENQDRVAVLKFRPTSKAQDMIVVALADGMGGMEGGANAASLTLSNFFTEIIKNSHLPIRECLEQAVLRANDAVLNIYKGKGGSTLTAIALDDRENITAINVGDSRIYKISSDDISQLSEDDTLAALAIKYQNHIGMDISEIDSRFGGELVQFIGLDGVLEIHFQHVNFKENDIILLSSDGAHIIGKDNLKKLFTHSANTGVFSRRIIDLANWFGGFDNASVAVVELSGLHKELDVSSGDIINMWNPFGELQVVRIVSHSSGESRGIGTEPSYNLKGKQKNIEETVSDGIIKTGSDTGTRKAVVKRKTRAKTKTKNNNEKNDRKIELNGNDKLEDISQLDMPFSHGNSVKGNENDK